MEDNFDKFIMVNISVLKKKKRKEVNLTPDKRLGSKDKSF